MSSNHLKWRMPCHTSFPHSMHRPASPQPLYLAPIYFRSIFRYGQVFWSGTICSDFKDVLHQKFHFKLWSHSLLRHSFIFQFNQKKKKKNFVPHPLGTFVWVELHFILYGYKETHRTIMFYRVSVCFPWKRMSRCRLVRLDQTYGPRRMDCLKTNINHFRQRPSPTHIFPFHRRLIVILKWKYSHKNKDEILKSWWRWWKNFYMTETTSAK